MADFQHSTRAPNGNLLSHNRRSLLAAGIVTVATASFAAPTPEAITHNEWDAAMARYKAALHQMEAKGTDESASAFVDAEQDAMGLPAPDLKALRWKIERLREISADTHIEPAGFDCLLADCQRLLSKGGL